MSNNIDETSPLQQRFAEVFARLHDQDIEQFYAHYQLWVLRQRVPFLEKQIETLQGHIAENQQQIEKLQPPAIALAVLARLQSNGVKDIELLDQMLERGEDWLDRMMQRLDYCEQVEDFIQGDYTQWCVNSLEGAYDWIDSLRDSTSEETTSPQATDPPAEVDIQATEELLLQKLSLDDEEAMMGVTLKRPAIQLTQSVEGATEAETQEAPEESVQTPAGEQQTELVATVESREEEASSSELQEVAENEIPAEMSNWQDLESPEEPSAPWYSVNLEKDASLQGEQAEVMDNWITILQAENPAPAETGEAETPSPALPVENEEQAEVVTPEQADASEEEQAAQETTISEERAAEPVSQEEQEVVSEPGEEPAPEENEALTAEFIEAGNELERETEQESTPASEETQPVESAPASEESRAESEVAEVTASEVTGPVVAEAAQYTISSEAAENELIDVVKAIEFLSIAEEEPSTEVEVLEETGSQVDEERASMAVAVPEEVEPQADEEERLAAIEKPEEAESQADEEEASIAIAVSEETESRAAEETPEETEQAVQQEEQEVSPTQASEVEEQEVSPAPTGAEEEQEAAPALTGEMEEQEAGPATSAEEQETNSTGKNEAEEQGHEVEEAAIANDILGPEGEQLAWYEYLELDEQGNVSPSEHNEERIEPEASSISSEAEPPEDAESTPELHEYVVAGESEEAQTPGEATSLEESVQRDQEQIAIEGWQVWGAQQEDDETLPMPLKEITQAQELPANAAPEPQVTSPEVMEQASVDEGIAPGESVESSGESLPEAVTASEIVVVDRHIGISEAEEALAQPVQVTPVTQPAPGEEPPTKRGFWQRLFGWMRKK